jgi:hypothetical protein
LMSAQDFSIAVFTLAMVRSQVVNGLVAPPCRPQLPEQPLPAPRLVLHLCIRMKVAPVMGHESLPGCSVRSGRAFGPISAGGSR